MNTTKALAIARKHLHGQESRDYLAVAVKQHDGGDYVAAVSYAERSLRASVGTKHPDYRRVHEAANKAAFHGFEHD